MKKIFLTVAQLALLVKVKEETTFYADKINNFIDENKGKEEIPELELDNDEFADFTESLEVFNGSEADNAAIATWLTELKPAEEVTEAKETNDQTAEPVAEVTDNQPEATNNQPGEEDSK